jgi:tRNA nucleotidyltransferase (CCA-adding enzyme)
VRDLFLGRPTLDLDLVVEGDAVALARALARREGAQVVAHPRFGTAKLKRGGLAIDLATARSETYTRPGALPTVQPGSIKSDLFRRDFTINAMACYLDAARFGEVLDPFRGQADLEQGLVRVLHEQSFVDDATRILRALRYEQRLGFRLEPTTEALLRRDLSMLDTISGDRLRHELEHILKEERPERILGRAGDLGVLQRLHPSLEGDGWLAQCFQRARELGWGSLSVLYICLLCYRLTPEEAEGIIARLNIAGEAARALRDTISLKDRLCALAQPRLPSSRVYRLLEGFSEEALLAALCAGDPVAVEPLRLYLDKLRLIKPALNGEALKRLGVAPGPEMGEMLRALHEAKLDGKVKTAEQEEALVRRGLAGGSLPEQAELVDCA